MQKKEKININQPLSQRAQDLIITLLKTFLLPPALPLTMMLIAAMLWRRAKATALCLLLLAWGSLLLLSLPAVSAALFHWLEAPYIETYKEAHKAIDNTLSVDAVVVLGGGRQRHSPEYPGDQVSYHALWRLRYGVRLARQQQLPIIISGGTVRPYETVSEAAIAAKLLAEEFDFTNVLLEERSRNTWENAQYTAALLEEKGIQRVILVSHAYHLRRAQLAFEQAGVDIVPMPTGFLSRSTNGWIDDWLPHTLALSRSRVALHEYIGLAVYYIKHLSKNARSKNAR